MTRLARGRKCVLARVPEAPRLLAEQVVSFVEGLREVELYKAAGVSETLDWMAALVALDRRELDEATVETTLGILLKNQEDIEKVRAGGLARLLARSREPA